MTKDQQRAAFEAWASKKWPGASFAPDQNNCGIVVTERYKHPKLQAAREAWQAALASPEVQALRKQNSELSSLVAEMVEHDTYETEYDGRMYSICSGCGAQDEEDHQPDCVYERARAALAARKKQP